MSQSVCLYEMQVGVPECYLEVSKCCTELTAELSMVRPCTKADLVE